MTKGSKGLCATVTPSGMDVSAMTIRSFWSDANEKNFGEDVPFRP